MSQSAPAHPQNPGPCTPAPRSPAGRTLLPASPLSGPAGHATPGTRTALCKVPRGVGRALQKRRWAGLGLAGRPARAAPQNPWRPGVGGAARPRPGERGRGAEKGPRRSEAGGSVWPRRGALPRARGGARSGPRGHGQPGDPGVRTQVPSNRSRCPCRMHRRRGARRVHTHLPLRGPRSARRAGGRRRALCSAERSPIPDRRPARGRADGPRARRAPSRPAAAAPRSAPAGRGGERRRAASTRFPGRRASGPSPLQTSSRQRQRLGAQRALRPALGSPWVSPQASVTNFATPSSSTPPPPCYF